MTNKKTALEQLKKPAGFQSGVILGLDEKMRLAILELAERVEALQSKFDLFVELTSNELPYGLANRVKALEFIIDAEETNDAPTENDACKPAGCQSAVALNDARTIELPDDGCTVILPDDAFNDMIHKWYPEFHGRNKLTAGSITFIHAKKDDEPKASVPTEWCEEHNRYKSVGGKPMCAPCIDPIAYADYEKEINEFEAINKSINAKQTKKGGNQ